MSIDRPSSAPHLARPEVSKPIGLVRPASAAASAHFLDFEPGDLDGDEDEDDLSSLRHLKALDFAPTNVRTLLRPASEHAQKHLLERLEARPPLTALLPSPRSLLSTRSPRKTKAPSSRGGSAPSSRPSKPRFQSRARNPRASAVGPPTIIASVPAPAAPSTRARPTLSKREAAVLDARTKAVLGGAATDAGGRSSRPPNWRAAPHAEPPAASEVEQHAAASIMQQGWRARSADDIRALWVRARKIVNIVVDHQKITTKRNDLAHKAEDAELGPRVFTNANAFECVPCKSRPPAPCGLARAVLPSCSPAADPEACGSTPAPHCSRKSRQLATNANRLLIGIGERPSLQPTAAPSLRRATVEVARARYVAPPPLSKGAGQRSGRPAWRRAAPSLPGAGEAPFDPRGPSSIWRPRISWSDGTRQSRAHRPRPAPRYPSAAAAPRRTRGDCVRGRR